MFNGRLYERMMTRGAVVAIRAFCAELLRHPDVPTSTHEIAHYLRDYADSLDRRFR